MRRCRWASCMLAARALACGDTAGQDGIEIELRARGSELPARYRVVLGAAARTPAGISCPGDEPSDGLRCTQEGIALAGADAGAELTVKARGFAFATHTLSEDDLALRRVTLELVPLPEAEATADYRTGLDAESGEDDFLALAVSTPTELGTAQSVKFYLADLAGAPRVYLQNTRRHPLHYEFAHDALGLPESRAEQSTPRTTTKP